MAKRIVWSLALAAILPVIAGGCASTTSSTPKSAQPGFLDKLGTSVKSGTAKIAAAVTPQTRATRVPTPPPSGEAGPKLFVAVAQMREESGEFNDAEAQYQKALDADPNYLAALTGYARLEDRRHNFEAAVKLYQRAIKKHPKDAAVHNDLGLCFHRHGKLPEAVKELERAVELNQEGKLYRDNLAAVYVDQGKTKEALAQLTVAHGEAVGHYNLAYLLEQKQDHAAALVHFRKAAERDPTLVAAQQWIDRLSSNNAPSGAATSAAIVVANRTELTVSADHNARAAFTVDPVVGDSQANVNITAADTASGDTNVRASRLPATAEKTGVEYHPAPRLTNALRSAAPAASERKSDENRLPTVTPQSE